MNGTAGRPRLLPLDQLPPAAVEGLVRDHGASPLLEPPYAGERRSAGEPRHRYLLELLGDDSVRDDAVALAAVVGDTVTGLAVLRLPRWDEDHFGFPVGRVEHLIAGDAGSAELLADEIVREFDARGARMSSARLSVAVLPAIQALEARGYRFQEHTLTPWRSLSGWEAQEFGVTRETRPDDLPELRTIARHAFRTDRFHHDARFGRAAADGLYEKWVRTWHEDAAADKWSWVLLVEGRVAGFILFDIPSRPSRRVARVVLDCVSPEHAGRGYGHKMQCDVLDHLSGRVDYVSSVIATRNVAALAMNIRLGFRFSNGGEATFHRWT